ncbi:MAG: hypothetical protein ACPL0F_07985 [bacterium]
MNTHINPKKALCVMLALLLIAVPVMAQQTGTAVTDYLQGKLDGERDGRSSSPILWALAGCCLGLIGILIAYLTSPTVPTDRLIGKSPEYIQGYIEAYQKKGKLQNALWSGLGCLVGTALTCIYYILMAESSYSYSY